jgi:hypothetical protein
MSESKQSHHGNEDPERGPSVHHEQPAYWKRMHRDWRFWVGLVFMFAAITIYVMSDNLSLRFGGQPHHSMPADVAP